MLRTRAQSMVEYAVLIGGVVAAVILFAALFGSSVTALITDALASI